MMILKRKLSMKSIPKSTRGFSAYLELSTKLLKHTRTTQCTSQSHRVMALRISCISNVARGLIYLSPIMLICIISYVIFFDFREKVFVCLPVCKYKCCRYIHATQSQVYAL